MAKMEVDLLLGNNHPSPSRATAVGQCETAVFVEGPVV